MILTTTRNIPAENLPVKSEPWMLAIKGQFGEYKDFRDRFFAKPDTWGFCASDKGLRRAIELDDRMPSLTRACRTYGTANVKNLIGAHVSAAIIAMGEQEKFNPFDAQNAAALIVECKRWRHLKFSTVLGFFHALTTAEYKIYGSVTPRKILEVYQQYCERAHEREHEERCRIEKEREEAERAAYEAKCRPWEERAAELGLPPGTSLADWIHMGIAEDEQKGGGK